MHQKTSAHLNPDKLRSLPIIQASKGKKVGRKVSQRALRVLQKGNALVPTVRHSYGDVKVVDVIHDRRIRQVHENRLGCYRNDHTCYAKDGEPHAVEERKRLEGGVTPQEEWDEDVDGTGRVVEAAVLFLFNPVWGLRSVAMT